MANWKIPLRGKRRYARDRLPPTQSTRYCLICKEETIFKYNKGIGHSECSIYGYRKIPKINHPMRKCYRT